MNFEKYQIPADRAKKYAVDAIFLFLRGRHPKIDSILPGALRSLRVPNIPGHLEDLSMLFPEPARKVYDVHGNLWFYDHRQSLLDGIELRIRITGNKVLRTPLLTVALGCPYDLEHLLGQAKEAAAQAGLTPVTGVQQFVCYAFPKLALLCSGDGGRAEIVDLADRRIYPVEPAKDVPRDIAIVSSPFDDVPEGSEAEAAAEFDSAGQALDDLAVSVAEALAGKRPVLPFSVQEAVLPNMHFFFQEEAMYCAPASGQMILDYHLVNEAQGLVAAAMHTSLNTGTLPDKEVAGYNAIAGGMFQANIVRRPGVQFARFRHEIDQGRPAKSGVLGHARAIGGWGTMTINPNSFDYLLVYDPSPTIGGVRWEIWGALEERNIISVQPNNPV